MKLAVILNINIQYNNIPHFNLVDYLEMKSKIWHFFLQYYYVGLEQYFFTRRYETNASNQKLPELAMEAWDASHLQTFNELATETERIRE